MRTFPPPAADEGAARESTLRRWSGTLLTLAVLAVIVVWAVRRGPHLDLTEVWAAVRALSWVELGTAALLSVASYAVYATYDLLSRQAAGLKLPLRRIVAVGLVSHACGVNFGPLGGVSRGWLYWRLGEHPARAATVWAFNVATNWLGFAALSGAVLLCSPRAPTLVALLPPAIGSIAGGLLCAAVLAWIVACALAAGRELHLGRWRLSLPRWPVAAAQVGASALNWLLLVALIATLLRWQAPLIDVFSAVAGTALALLVADVPAGLGVAEALYLSVLGDRLPASQILAALLAYRAVYMLLPLPFAAVLGWRLARLGPAEEIRPATPARADRAAHAPRAAGTESPRPRPRARPAPRG